MTWRQRQNQSHWREFEFMLHQVQRAIDTRLPLRSVFDQWPSICQGLAEAQRKRRPRDFSLAVDTCETS
jgi:hypothetical protein